MSREEENESREGEKVMEGCAEEEEEEEEEYSSESSFWEGGLERMLQKTVRREQMLSSMRV